VVSEGVYNFVRVNRSLQEYIVDYPRRHYLHLYESEGLHALDNVAEESGVDLDSSAAAVSLASNCVQTILYVFHQDFFSLARVELQVESEKHQHFVSAELAEHLDSL